MQLPAKRADILALRPSAPEEEDIAYINHILYTVVDFAGPSTNESARDIYVVSNMKPLTPGQEDDTPVTEMKPDTAVQQMFDSFRILAKPQQQQQQEEQQRLHPPQDNGVMVQTTSQGTLTSA